MDLLLLYPEESALYTATGIKGEEAKKLFPSMLISKFARDRMFA